MIKVSGEKKKEKSLRERFLQQKIKGIIERNIEKEFDMVCPNDFFSGCVHFSPWR
jgi:hypothetical protein